MPLPLLQDIFVADPSVMLIDMHQQDVWPGSGGEGETGEGEWARWAAQRRLRRDALLRGMCGGGGLRMIECRHGDRNKPGGQYQRVVHACLHVCPLMSPGINAQPAAPLPCRHVLQAPARVPRSTCLCPGTAGTRRRSGCGSEWWRLRRGASSQTCSWLAQVPLAAGSSGSVGQQGVLVQSERGGAEPG